MLTGWLNCLAVCCTCFTAHQAGRILKYVMFRKRMRWNSPSLRTSLKTEHFRFHQFSWRLKLRDLGQTRKGYAMSLNTASSVAEPRQAHQLDAVKLLAYLKQSLPALRSTTGSLVVKQFQHGQVPLMHPTALLLSMQHATLLNAYQQVPAGSCCRHVHIMPCACI